jgi:hypothetical protein
MCEHEPPPPPNRGRKVVRFLRLYPQSDPQSVSCPRSDPGTVSLRDSMRMRVCVCVCVGVGVGLGVGVGVGVWMT